MHQIQNYLNKLIKKDKSIIQVHGFYVDEEINMISFDLIFNFDVKNVDEKIKILKEELKKEYPKYDYNIIVDLDYSD